MNGSFTCILGSFANISGSCTSSARRENHSVAGVHGSSAYMLGSIAGMYGSFADISGSFTSSARKQRSASSRRVVRMLLLREYIWLFRGIYGSFADT